MPEHYQHNSTRQGTEPQYFNSEISRISCSRWDAVDPAHELKVANLPPWKSDWKEFLDVIDVFKLHGREDSMRLLESMDLIKRWDDPTCSLMYPEFKDYMQDVDMPDAPINKWREKIKTCKFDCWDCNYCETVVEFRLKKQKREMNPLVDRVIRAIDNAVDDNSNFKPDGYNVLGLSSNKVRHFLNNLCSERGTIYADVGCYTGSTLFAALMGNQSVKAYAIDDFSEGCIRPKNKNLFDKYTIDNPIDEFIQNAEKYFNTDCSVGFCVKPILQMEFNPEFKPNVIFYDAEIEDNMIPNLEHIHNQAADSYILVVDDANFNGAVDNAKEFLKGKDVVYDRIIRTEIVEDEKDWWNGLYIAVIEKMINIIDNYLPEQTYHNIRNQMLAFNFPWFSSKIVNDSPQNYKRNVQMIHMFYTNHAPQTDHLEIIYPLLDKIQPLSIIKIKANFMTVQIVSLNMDYIMISQRQKIALILKHRSTI